MKDLVTTCREPTLKEILSEEITEAMMAADRVNRDELEAMLTDVARTLERGAPLQPSSEAIDARTVAVE
jgi:hypothetical protein